MTVYVSSNYVDAELQRKKSSMGDDNVNDVNLLDTGTTKLVSIMEDDFNHELPSSRALVIGVGSNPIEGRLMKCTPNEWGIEEGVLVASLPADITRLVPVPRGHKLNEYGTGEPGGYIRCPDGTRKEVIATIPPRVSYKKFSGLTVYAAYTTKTKTKTSNISKRRLHERLGHLTKDKNCLACKLAKKVRKSFKKERAKKYMQPRPLAQLDMDFMGPISPESLRRCRYGLLIVCPRSKMVWAVPIRHKSQNTDEVAKVLHAIRAEYGREIGDKVLYYIRTDNEPVWDGSFSKFLNQNDIISLRPAPYCPQANGLVERLVRSVTEGVRSQLIGVDKRLWCWCLELFAQQWREAKPVKGGKTPKQIAAELRNPDDPRDHQPEMTTDENLDRASRKFRKFGSLAICYKSNPAARAEVLAGLPPGKFNSMFTVGVYLGLDSRGESAIVGIWENGGSVFVERREKHVDVMEVGAREQ